TVVLNRNDLMDQTIVFSGAAFDNALFWFGTPGGSPVTTGRFNGLVEVVDNVTFDAAAVPVPVPEPGTLALLGLALVGSTLRRRRS
ncbi:MAG: PEP-CTERM sorting domain-containing protein, partial [Vicinamibacterales bacterium]